MSQPLVRSSSDRILGGVCGGFARFLGVQVNIVRLVTVVLVIFFGISLWVYIAAWFLLPLDTTNKSGLETVVESIKNSGSGNSGTQNPTDLR